MLRFLPKLKKYMKKSPLADIDIPRAEFLEGKNFSDFYFSKEEISQILGYSVSDKMLYNEIEKLYKKSKIKY